jgi:hypothetical protein
MRSKGTDIVGADRVSQIRSAVEASLLDDKEQEEE